MPAGDKPLGPRGIIYDRIDLCTLLILHFYHSGLDGIFNYHAYYRYVQ